MTNSDSGTENHRDRSDPDECDTVCRETSISSTTVIDSTNSTGSHILKNLTNATHSNAVDTPWAVTFDLFGTLVSTPSIDNPADLVAEELSCRGISVPADWEDYFLEPHIEVDAGEEIPLNKHVEAALAAGSDAGESATDEEKRLIREAVIAAYDIPVSRRDGAQVALAAAREIGPVGLLSNCSVPGLVERTLERTDLGGSFDATLASVDCGLRKPDPRSFQAIADRLGVATQQVIHVGDDATTDGGMSDAGGTVILLDDTTLQDLPARLKTVVET